MITNRHIIAGSGLATSAVLGLALALYGVGGEGWLYAARWTARWALVPFLLTFTASVLIRHVRSPWLRNLLRHRRGLGLGFALSHAIHMGAFLAYFAVSGARPKPVISVGGGLGYLFILAMALTSTDAMRRALGRAWPHLHKWGMRYVFLIFANSYIGRILEGGDRTAQGIAGTTLLALALLLKLSAIRRT